MGSILWCRWIWLTLCQSVTGKMGKTTELTGIEISSSAILAASNSAKILGLEYINFQSLDAASVIENKNENKPDLVIVNPPRRGIGKKLSEFLNEMQSDFVLYSSCNSVTMGKDFTYLTHYKPLKIQLLICFHKHLIMKY